MRPSSFRPVAASLVLAFASTLPACAATSTRPALAVHDASAAPSRLAAAPAGRLRPPVAISCDRNHLTSWTGVVTGYRRKPGSTWLRIATDEDTVESTTIRHPDAPDGSARYLLRGAVFQASDVARIESNNGALRAGMRATAWICDDGVTPPVIDWQPPAT